jgi:DNA-binding NtrC family response regulator
LREAQADCLVAAGFPVIEATTSDEALSYLESRSDVRLVVTDIDVPGCFSGPTLARFVGRRWPQIPIIIMGWPHRPIPGLAGSVSFLSTECPPSALAEQARASLSAVSC